MEGMVLWRLNQTDLLQGPDDPGKSFGVECAQRCTVLTFIPRRKAASCQPNSRAGCQRQNPKRVNSVGPSPPTVIA